MKKAGIGLQFRESSKGWDYGWMASEQTFKTKEEAEFVAKETVADLKATYAFDPDYKIESRITVKHF